jgi:ADP-heptose:LPS heptosyltransferase
MWFQTPTPRRLLIVRNDRVGDLLLTLPAIDAARRHWPTAYLAVLASPVAASLLKNYPGIDQLLVDDPQHCHRTLGDRLKAERFDTAVVAHTTWRNFKAVCRAGIKCRVGWAGKLPGLVLATHRVFVSRSKPPLHEADFVMRLMQRLDVQGHADDYPPQLVIDQVVRNSVAARIEEQLGTDGPLFGVNPSHFKGAYNWPVHRYADLISKLAELGRVLVTVGPNETDVFYQLEQRWSATFGGKLPPHLAERIALVSEFDLRELAAAISLVDVFTVGNTGPMHLAGVLNTPMVALFSTHPSQAPARWRPLGHQRVMLQPLLGDEEDPHVPPAKADEHMCRIGVGHVLDANLAWLKWRLRNQLLQAEQPATIPFKKPELQAA